MSQDPGTQTRLPSACPLVKVMLDVRVFSLTIALKGFYVVSRYSHFAAKKTEKKPPIVILYVNIRSSKEP